MIWLRKGVVLLLSLIFIAALFATATTTTLYVAIAKPNNIEAWLTDSKFYDHFIDNVITQAQKSSSDSSNSPTGTNQSSGQTNGNSSSSDDGIQLTDPGVKDAAEAAFPPALLQQYVNTFLNANYAWLEGKTTKPVFTIDVTTPAKMFAQQVGAAVTTHLASLPVCTSAQLAALTSQDPLTLTCRPPNVNPAAAGAKITTKLSSGDGPFSKTVFTAESISSPFGSGTTTKAAYYNGKLVVAKKYTVPSAPTIYKYATGLPWLSAGIAILCLIGIIFIAPRKRRGIRRVAIVLLEVSLVLIALKFLADWAYKRAADQALQNPSNGPLAKSVIDVAHRAEHQITMTNLYFGIGFLVLAVLIFILLLSTKGRDGKAAKQTKSLTPDESQAAPVPASNKSTKPVMDITGKAPRKTAGQTTTAPTLPSKPSAPSKPKRPRLIQ